MDYKSGAVRIAYRHVKAILLDPAVKKVVLIGHSQGGIIISLVIDQLLAELPATYMSKLEIYTFGSAASHFSNPLISAPAEPKSPVSRGTDGPLGESAPPRHVISHIEHYANEYDMICRWGVLHRTQGVLNNRYAGSIFVRMGATGHMLNQHYLDRIFPIPVERTQGPAENFFGSALLTDDTTAKKRVIVAADEDSTTRQDGALSAKKDHAISTFSGRLSGGMAQNESVRDLSRLWRYQNGQSPST